MCEFRQKPVTSPKIIFGRAVPDNHVIDSPGTVARAWWLVGGLAVAETEWKIRGERGVGNGEWGIHTALLVQHHFFAAAAQLTTTVSGAFGSVSTTALIRNRCPSPVTA